MAFLKSIARALAAASLVALAANAAHAWPTRPVRIIVPGSAGSAPDTAVRHVADRIAATLKQPVVVENRVGAGGIVALQAFQASSDDHTFLFVITSTSAIAPLTFKAASSVDYVRDFQPVVGIAQTPLMIVAQPNSGAKTLADVLKLAREKPGEYVFATPSPNTLGHLAVALISQSTGAKFNTVPFSRAGDSLASVTAGDSSFYVDGISVVLPFVRSNRLQPIAVLSSTKLPGLEAYPLGRETVPGLEVVGRFGLVTSKDNGAANVETMAKAMMAALAQPDVAAKLRELGLYPTPIGPAEYHAVLRQESEMWGKVVRAAGIKPE